MSSETPDDELPIVILRDGELQGALAPGDGEPFARPGRTAPRILLACGIAAAVLSGALFVFGHEYYALPLARRHLHDLHEILRSSGRLGLVLGIAGTGLMLLNLTYLLRKRLLALRWAGALRSWMAFHVLTGLVGPALILFHTAFHLQSALGVLAFSAMLLVVLTGLIGRYIYAHVPRSLEGRELEEGEVLRRLARYKGELVARGVDPSALSTRPSAATADHPRSIPRSLARVLLGNRRSRKEYRQLASAIRSVPALRALARELLPLARRLCRERLWLSRFEELRWLMSSWRFFHRWLAIVMLLIVCFHIAVAVRFGDLWILAGDR